MAIINYFQRHCCIVIIFFLASMCCLQFAEAQQNWNKPVAVTNTRRSSAATTREPVSTPATVKSKRFLDSKKVVFPEDDSTQFPYGKMPQQIPLSLLNELNEATDWSDFLKYVDNVTVIQSEDDQHPYVYGTWEDFGVDGRTGGSGIERDASIPAKAANCMPELQTVPLMANTDPSVIFYPTCTRVERCGGCCSSELLVCEPTKTETILFQVLKTQYAGGTRMKFAGKESVPVEKHTACKCQCRVKESHCTANQIYIPGSCRCECSNLDDRNKCEADNQTRYWDSRNCICRCRDNGTNQQCSTGFYFNEDICGCDRPWAVRRREDVDGSQIFPIAEDNRQPTYNNNVPTKRSLPPSRPIYKDEDNYEEEDKKSKPIERFQFVNSWIPNKPVRQQPKNV